jgi:hypothetical protein
LVGRILLHGGRRTLHMHQADRDIQLGGHR